MHSSLYAPVLYGIELLHNQHALYFTNTNFSSIFPVHSEQTSSDPTNPLKQTEDRIIFVSKLRTVPMLISFLTFEFVYYS